MLKLKYIHLMMTNNGIFIGCIIFDVVAYKPLFNLFMTNHENSLHYKNT